MIVMSDKTENKQISVYHDWGGGERNVLDCNYLLIFIFLSRLIMKAISFISQLMLLSLACWWWRSGCGKQEKSNFVM